MQPGTNNALLQLAGATRLSDQIRLLVDYHGRVMTERGQQPWLSLGDKGVKVHVRPMRNPSEENWPQGVWYNSYYLPQFKWLVRDLSESGGMKLLTAFKEQLKALGQLRYVWFTSFNINIEFIETYLLPAVLDMEQPKTRFGL